MTDGTQSAPDVTPDLRLRPERPQVTRLSRKVLISLGAVSSLAIAAALIYALQTRRADQDNKELYSTENRPTPDGLTDLPRDYTGIPKLGPPLPGDLGRPILSAQNQGQPIPPGGPLPQPGITPEEQRPAGDRGRASEQALRSDRDPRRVTCHAGKRDCSTRHHARSAGGSSAA